MAIYEIELENTYSNQEFDVTFEEIENSIHVLLQTVNNILMMSVFVNNVQLGEAFMCFPNQPIIPYQYIVEELGGNFLFETQDDNYPNYENFGKTCILNFLTRDEF